MGILISIGFYMCFCLMRRHKLSVSYFLLGFLLVVYISTMLSEIVGFPTISKLSYSHAIGEPIYFPHIIDVPFSRKADLSTYLNVIAFIPFGIGVTLMWKKFNSLLITLLTGFLFSLVIEVGQLFTINRQTDVNDLIMNTLGVGIGWGLARLALRWKMSHQHVDNNDWFLFITVPLLSVFVFG